jgi:TetR/AcrR family transcriptional regulator, transcriptional repressor for nem operon
VARTSRKEKEQTHRRIVEKATQAFRASGVAGTSIPALMEEVNLTHGTFYAHFANKDALVAEAYVRGLGETVDNLLHLAGEPAPGGGLEAVIAHYLSAQHRDNPAGGCLLPALAGEVRRESPPVRHAFTNGLNDYFERLGQLIPERNGDADKDQALVLASGMAGAVLLARAVDDPELSDSILRACRAFYTAAFAGPPATSDHEND